MCHVIGLELHGEFAANKKEIKIMLRYDSLPREHVLTVKKEDRSEIFHPVYLRDLFVGKTWKEAHKLLIENYHHSYLV